MGNNYNPMKPSKRHNHNKTMDKYKTILLNMLIMYIGKTYVIFIAKYTYILYNKKYILIAF